MDSLLHSDNDGVTIYCSPTTPMQRLSMHARYLRSRGFFYRLEPILFIYGFIFACGVGGAFDGHLPPLMVSTIVILAGSYLAWVALILMAIALGVTRSHRWMRPRASLHFRSGAVHERLRNGAERDRTWAWVVGARESAAFLSFTLTEKRNVTLLVERARCSSEAYERLRALLLEKGKLSAPRVEAQGRRQAN